MTTLENLPPDIARLRVLDSAETLAFVNLSPREWRRMWQGGEAPSPVRLGERKLGWQVGDLADWIQSRKKVA